MPLLICHVVGARPNFMKAAPVMHALNAYLDIQQTLVHTGQHYDLNMSEVFFQQLGMPTPDFNLQVGSGSHAQQTAAIMRQLEPVLLTIKPNLVVVYGDVNSTIAVALVASKLGIAIAHVEAGLRSFDRSMPEEINRVLTDQISDLLFTPSEDGNRNLAREGIPDHRVHLVGNVMIDTLVRMLPHSCLRSDDLPERYILVTLHRPSNVDDLPWLQEMIAVLEELGEQTPVLFPVHPRTAKALWNAGRDAASCVSTAGNDQSRVASGESKQDWVLDARRSTLDAGSSKPEARVRLMDPQPYLEFLALEQRAALVITDSGGVQEETTFLGIPCLTVRENTERPVTVECGTNLLVGRDLDRLRDAAHEILNGKTKRGRIPPLWDGHAAERIAKIIESLRN
jgi:UDP-N-acetylglucosamine 2-epimerase (non-hydrolysing)